MTASTSSISARPAKPSPPAGPPIQLSHRKVLAVVAGLMLGMLLSGLDQTIVATASRTIGDDLHGLNQQAWLTTAFLITSTLTTLVYGKLSDLLGRKWLYMIAISIFLLGSALSGLATSMPMLAAFRAIQGIGAGGLMTLAFAITADIISPRDRGKYQGYFAATMAISSVLGPMFGGLFADAGSILGVTGWRWAFWVNIPIGIAALIVIAKTLPAAKPTPKPGSTPESRRVDTLGIALLSIALVPLLVVGQEGMNWGWGSTTAIWCYIVGGAGTIAFIAWELHMKSAALLPLNLMRRRTFVIPVLITFFIGAAQFGGIVVVPLYLQIAMGASPTLSGLLLIPMVLGMSITSVVVGRLVKSTGRVKIFPIVGMATLTIAYLGLSTVGMQTPLWGVDIWMFLIGIGLGASANTIILMLQSSVDFTQFGVASASGTFFRNIGATAGTAVLLTVLFSKAQSGITAAYQSAQSSTAFIAAAAAHPDQVRTLQHGLATGLSDTSFLNRIDSTLAAPYLSGFTHAMDTVSLIGAIIAGLGFLLTLTLKEVHFQGPGVGGPGKK